MSPAPAEIRKFILDTYDEEEFFELFCEDYFPQAKGEFSAGNSYTLNVQRLISYCISQNLLDNLLAALQKERPESYAERFQSTETAPEQAPTPFQARIRNERQKFISHAHQDAAFAHRLASDLRKQGIEIWIAPDSIKAGEKWVEALERGMDESGTFVTVLTPAASQSQWVRQEAYSAIALENRGVMRLIPVYAEECDVPTMLSGYQRVTMLNRYEDGFTELLVAIRGQAPTPQEVMDLQLQRQPFNATPPDVTVITEQSTPLNAEPLDVRITSDHTPEHDVAPVDSASDRRALPVRTLLLSAAVLGLVVFLIIIAASNLAATPAENSTESTAEGMPTPEGEVITTDSGLMYIEISEGTGAQPQNGQTVSVRYIGYLDNGDVYETSDQHSDPFQYVVGEGSVIKGLDEGVSTMRVGGHRRLIIPPELGYGDQEQPNVPANSQLTLLVELLDVE